MIRFFLALYALVMIVGLVVLGYVDREPPYAEEFTHAGK